MSWTPGLVVLLLVLVGGVATMACRTCGISPMLGFLVMGLVFWAMSGGGPGGPPIRPA